MGKITPFWTAVLVLVIAAFFVFSQDTLARQLSLWQIGMDLPGFKLVKQSEDATKTLTKQELEAKRGNTTLRISKIKVSDHQKFIDDKKFLLASLFEPTTSPYPEVITNIVSCPDEFKPKESAVSNGTIYTLFAGERQNFGVCSKDLVKYNAAYGIFDCGQKGVFEVRLFGESSDELKTIIETFSC